MQSKRHRMEKSGTPNRSAQLCVAVGLGEPGRALLIQGPDGKGAGLEHGESWSRCLPNIRAQQEWPVLGVRPEGFKNYSLASLASSCLSICDFLQGT